MLVIVKIGSSSVVNTDNGLNLELIENISAQVAKLIKNGHKVVLVSSGAVALGITHLADSNNIKKEDLSVKQALAAVGQFKLMEAYSDAFSSHDVLVGQVLLTPNDFIHRNQYLNAKNTLTTLLSMDILPIINENDAVATDEIRFSDNDRIAALVANMLKADLLILLTDISGMFTSDPSVDEGATLIKEINELTDRIHSMASDTNSSIGSGGMVAKLAAAKIATWSGVKVIIGGANQKDILTNIVLENKVLGTVIHPKVQKLNARKLWIAFAKASHGSVEIDQGALDAILSSNGSLLPKGVTNVGGEFEVGDAIDVISDAGKEIAKGIAKISSVDMIEYLSQKNSEESLNLNTELIHRDDLVILT